MPIAKVSHQWRVMMILSLLCIISKSEEIGNINSRLTKTKRITQLTKGEQTSNVKKLSQGTSEEKVTGPPPEDEEDKKTLAQQVVDGKYGLIQTELFSRPVKRPGIISYEANPEVPKDNVNNLGGLQPQEIWLAENHLLVLKGGTFKEQEENGPVTWPPIDNYIAPHRQVKIPPNPKIPPPFPIQLKDGGPIEFIEGKNGTGGFPYLNPHFGPPFLSPGFADPDGNGTAKEQGNWREGNGDPFPLPPPKIGLYPPGVAFLPPPDNITALDEDDPTIYYPPKYDFVYSRANTSHVPPGPLVPGIILPPPPDFFGPLVNKSKPIRPITTENTRLPHKKQNKTRIQQSQRHKDTQSKDPIRPSKQKTEFQSGENNEVHTMPNVTFEEWVPIPAPRPFYITGLKNIIRPNVNSDQSSKKKIPQNGWVYQDPISENDKEISYEKKNEDVDDVNKKHIYYLPNIPKEKPIYQEIYIDPLGETDIKIINNENYKTVNIHEKGKYSTEIPKYSKNLIEANTLPTRSIYEDVTIKTPSLSGNILISRPKYRDNGRKSILTTKNPLSFFYFAQDPKHQSDDGYLYNVPVNKPIRYRTESQSFALSTPKTENVIVSTTKKPPIYEYSFSAPGYGSIEAPKVGNDFLTTPKPFENNFRPINPQYTYYDYQSQDQKNLKQAPEQYYKTEGSHYQPEYYSQKPYSGFNINSGGLETVFGQKINQEVTTPLPSGQKYHGRPFYDSYVTRVPKTHVAPFYGPRYIESKKPKSNMQSDNYSYYYSGRDRDPHYYEEVRPNHPLDSDIGVNYKLPRPPVNPDAEYVGVPVQGSSYISYRLPGGGGHFYFLSPQPVAVPRPPPPLAYPRQHPYLRTNLNRQLE